jgi:hypothetical protein
MGGYVEGATAGKQKHKAHGTAPPRDRKVSGRALVLDWYWCWIGTGAGLVLELDWLML